jgi:hypothetical protein
MAKIAKIQQFFKNYLRDQKIKFFLFFFDKKIPLIFNQLIEGPIPIVSVILLVMLYNDSIDPLVEKF